MTFNSLIIQKYTIMENNTNNASRGEIVIYQTVDGTTSIDVRFENDTVWLTQDQMKTLFQRDKSVISRHIRDIFNEGELDPEVVVAKNATTTRHGAIADKTQTHEKLVYNLDVIISVGYRVKSKRGTQFRIWATSVLKEYLIKGYAVRSNLAQQKYEDLKALVEVVGRTMGYLEGPKNDQIKPIFDVVRDYTYALDTLDAYDYQNLKLEGTTAPERFHATYENAMETIVSLRNKFGNSDLFGVEKDASFHSSIGQIYQTWDGKDLYPSIEEKAAMLLYLVVKNHSFVDGNKRIAATLFLWFMQNNGILYRPDGTKRVADAALVALTLMIAESHTDEMETMVKVVVNLINQKAVK